MPDIWYVYSQPRPWNIRASISKHPWLPTTEVLFVTSGAMIDGHRNLPSCSCIPSWLLKVGEMALYLLKKYVIFYISIKID